MGIKYQAASGSYRVLRGGCWGYATDGLRVAYRDDINPDNWDTYGGDGFRCVSGFPALQ